MLSHAADQEPSRVSLVVSIVNPEVRDIVWAWSYVNGKHLLRKTEMKSRDVQNSS